MSMMGYEAEICEVKITIIRPSGEKILITGLHGGVYTDVGIEDPDIDEDVLRSSDLLVRPSSMLYPREFKLRVAPIRRNDEGYAFKVRVFPPKKS